MSEFELIFENLSKALKRLEEALARARDDLEQDGVIQRFEFTFEMFWKALKAVLEHEGIAAGGVRSSMKQAFRYGYIQEEEVLLDMLEDRNRSSHVYSQKMAEKIFSRIKTTYFFVLKKNIDFLKQRIEEIFNST